MHNAGVPRERIARHAGGEVFVLQWATSSALFWALDHAAYSQCCLARMRTIGRCGCRTSSFDSLRVAQLSLT